MKVIPIDQFEGGHLIPLKTEPIGISLGQHAVYIATLDGSIRIHNAKSKELERTFRPLGGVISILYHRLINALMTIEANEQHNTVARIYVLDESSPVDNLPFVITLDHPDCSCLSYCPTTGNIVSASTQTISIYAPSHKTLGNGERILILTKVIDLVPRFVPKIVTLCCSYIGYASHFECNVVRVVLEPRPDDSEASLKDGKSSNSYKSIIKAPSTWRDDDACLNLDFDETSNSAIFIQLPRSDRDVPARPDSEIFGPVVIGTHSPKLPDESEYVLKHVELCLYRRSSAIFHSLQFVPAYTVASFGPIFKDFAVNPQANILEPLEGLGVHCFLSTPLTGSMYALSSPSPAAQEATRLVSTYLYSRPSVSAAMNDYLLYVLSGGSEGGVDTYTTRCLLLSHVDEGMVPMPDVSLIGNKNLIGAAQLAVTEGNVTVLSKMDADQSSPSTEPCYNLYVLETVMIDGLYERMKEEMVEYIDGNRPYYYQLLLEAHFLLRAKVSSLLHLKSKGLSYEGLDAFGRLLRETCAALARHIRGDKVVNWKRIVRYYVSSDESLDSLVQSLVPEAHHVLHPASFSPQGNHALLPSYGALVDLVDTLAFDASQTERCCCSTPMADTLYFVYFLVRPNEMSRVIACSSVRSFTPSFVLTLLKGISLDALSVSQRETYDFVFGLLSLQMGDDEGATSLLSSPFLSTMCTDTPSLLFSCSPEFPVAYAGGVIPYGGEELHKPSLLSQYLRQKSSLQLSEILLGVARAHPELPLGAIILTLSPSFDSGNFEKEFASTLVEVIYSEGFLTSYLEIHRASSRPSPRHNQTNVSDAEGSVSFSDASLASAIALLLRLYSLLVLNIDSLDLALFEASSSFKVVEFVNDRAWLMPALASLSILDTTASNGINNKSSWIKILVSKMFYLLITYVNEKTASLVFPFIEALPDSFPCLPYIKLLSFPHVGKMADAEIILLKSAPLAALDYAKFFLDSSYPQQWGDLMNVFLSLIQEYQDASEDISLEVLYSSFSNVLSYIAGIVEPRTFLLMLPKNGNLEYFLPFIEKSLLVNGNSSLSKEIGVRAGHDLKAN